MKTTEIELIEMVSEAISSEFSKLFDNSYKVIIFCGKGNNGSDGLATARILSYMGYDVTVVTLFDKSKCTREFNINFDRLPSSVEIFKSTDYKLDANEEFVIIDAIFGSGIKGEIPNEISNIFDIINQSSAKVVSIDLPSGLGTEFSNSANKQISADYTFAIEVPKLSLLLNQNSARTGRLIVINAGIKQYLNEINKDYYTFIDQELINKIKFNREIFSHKGNFGHALLVCGGEGMTGAAVLATSGALRSGCGLVTIHISKHESSVIHITNPSAIISLDPEDHFSNPPSNLQKYSSIGVGCGIGKRPETYVALLKMIESYDKPMVLDADALNILAANHDLEFKIPRNSILTPHLKELERLIGSWQTEEERYLKVKQYCLDKGFIVIVKGAYSQIFTPGGKLYINSTGTPGMAKGGSGDVLCGLISGLLARGIRPCEAAIFGVYIHGRAGDRAAIEKGIESMNSRDIIDYIKF